MFFLSIKDVIDNIYVFLQYFDFFIGIHNFRAKQRHTEMMKITEIDDEKNSFPFQIQKEIFSYFFIPEYFICMFVCISVR